MEKVKETLELLRKIKQYENKMDENNMKQREKMSFFLTSYFKGEKVGDEDIDIYKEMLLHSMIPSEKERSSALYRNVLSSYSNWFKDLQVDEYFYDAWEKIFLYANVDSKNPSWWMLERIYYEVQNIKDYSENEKISIHKSAFLGNFLACFPHSDDIRVVKLATQYFQDFDLFFYTMYEILSWNLSATEKIQLGTIWKDYEYMKHSSLIKERKI